MLAAGILIRCGGRWAEALLRQLIPRPYAESEIALLHLLPGKAGPMTKADAGADDDSGGSWAARTGNAGDLELPRPLRLLLKAAWT